MNTDLKVPRFATITVEFITHRPWVALGLSLLLMAVLIPGLARVKADYSHRGYFYDDDPMLMEFDRFERRFGNDDAVLIALHSPSGIFDVDSINVLKELTAGLWLIPEVIRVDSLANYNWVHADGDELIIEPFIPDDRPLTTDLLKARRKQALEHELIPDYLISRDGKTALLFATIKPGIEVQSDTKAIVDATRKLMEEHRRGDHVIHLSGGPVITHAFNEVTTSDLTTLVPMTMALTILLLVVTFRSVVGVLLSLLIIGAVNIGSIAFAGWVGVELTAVTAALPEIMIAISVGITIHLLVTFFRTYRRINDRKAAIEHTLLKNFLPTLMTSLTTVMGFLSFSTADLEPVAGLGFLAGFGTALAWVLSYFLLGPLLVIFPIKVQLIEEKKRFQSEDRSRAFIRFIARHRRLLISSFTAVSIVAGIVSFKNTINSDPVKYFREGYWMRRAVEFIEAEVGGARSIEVIVDAGMEEGIKSPEFLAKVDSFQSWLNRFPGVTRTVSIVDILKQTHRSLNGDRAQAYVIPETKEAIAQELLLYTMGLPQGMNINDRVTTKNDALRMTVLWKIGTSAEATAAIDAIEKQGRSLGLNVTVTGKNRLYQSMNGYVVRSFIVSVSLAIFLIGMSLIVFFRSLKMGLLAMLPNVVPLLIGGGVLWAIQKPIDVGLVLVMSICLGIAVDDTIHVITNFNRLKREGRSTYEALVDIYAHTSPSLIATTLVLCAAFGVFVFATFTPNVYLGIMSAVILLIALLCDLVFLPALLLDKRSVSDALKKNSG